MGFNKEAIKKTTMSPKQVIDKGKELKTKVDTTVEVGQVDYAAAYFSDMIYDAVMAPLKCICSMLFYMAALTVRKKVKTIGLLVVSVVTLVFLLFAIISDDITTIAIPVGAALTSIFLLAHSVDNVSAGLDKVLQEIEDLSEDGLDEKEISLSGRSTGMIRKDDAKRAITEMQDMTDLQSQIDNLGYGEGFDFEDPENSDGLNDDDYL